MKFIGQNESLILLFNEIKKNYSIPLKSFASFNFDMNKEKDREREFWDENYKMLLALTLSRCLDDS